MSGNSTSARAEAQARPLGGRQLAAIIVFALAYVVLISVMVAPKGFFLAQNAQQHSTLSD